MEEIKHGYKQTDIGVIPEEWNLSPVRNLGVFSKGSGISRAESNTGILPSIRYGEIYTVHNDYIKKFSSFISTEVAKKAKRLKCGDILFTASGETKEDIGKCVAFIHDIEAYAGGDIIILSPRNANSLFLGFLFNAPYVVKQKANKGQGDAIVHITKASVGDITVALPESVNEQTAIATALSDTDALIATLDKKIAKKQQIKQGAMQQLLTGKKRLPGFSGEWAENDFKDLCWFQEGPGLRNWQFTSCGIKVINVTNLENGVLDLSNTDRYISIEEFHSMYKHFEIDENDIVVASSGNSYGKSAIVRKKDLPLLMNTSVIRFKPKKGLNYNFLWVFLNSDGFKKQIDLLITGGAQPNFGPAHLNKLKIFMPNDIIEQGIIAQILTNMDNEIAQMEKERDKYVQLKAGMMQVLLTGKIRLT